MKKVSIITTCYNAEQYIAYAITSILTQKVNNDLEIEYIIVNDCSTDKSLEVINKSIQLIQNNKIKCFIYNLKENIGCGAARKYGIDHATGNYFMFLDADDYYIHSDFVNRAVKDIELYNADIVEYGVEFNEKQYKVDLQKEYTNKEEKLLALFKENNIKFNVWSKIYRKNIIKSFPYSTKRTFEDIRTIPFLLSNTNKIVVMPSVEIYYRINNNSIIRQNELETRIGTISAIAELFESFKDNKNILKAMYFRSLIDLKEVLNNHSSLDEGFNEMSLLNTYMLSYIYPNTYKNITFNIKE